MKHLSLLQIPLWACLAFSAGLKAEDVSADEALHDYRSVTLIDASLPDLNSLIMELPETTEVILLSPGQSIPTALLKGPAIDELHIISHGKPGTLELAGESVELTQPSSLNSSLFKTIKDKLTAQNGELAELYLYGCAVGEGAMGEQAVSNLASYLNTNVAASSDLTGPAASQANWDLEVATSATMNNALRLNDYQHTLDLIMTETMDGTTLANTIIDPSNTNISVTGVTVFGVDGQIATFTNGLSVPGFLDFDEGIVISSGTVSSLAGPNTADNTGQDIAPLAGADNDPQFNSLSTAPQGTRDAAWVEITFIPTQDTIKGTFVFASDEYNEYAPPDGSLSGGNTYYDVMAFFVNGVNYSITAAGTDVSINTVNQTLNAADFNSNDPSDDGNPAPINIAADGFTRRLTWTAPVTANQPNTLKFGIADGGDATFNSWLMVDKYAFEVLPAPVSVDLAVTKTDNTSAIAIGQPLEYQLTVTNTGTGATGREIVVTDTLPAGITIAGGLAEAISETGPNGNEWTCLSDASTPQNVICKSTVVLQTSAGNNTTTFGFATDPVPAGVDGNTLTNTATVTTTDLDNNSVNDTGTDQTLVTTTDTTSPTVSITNVPSLVSDLTPYTITLTFNEDVTGLLASDLVVVNGSAANLVSIDAQTYTVEITPTGAGNITVDLPSNAAQDSATNGNSAALQQNTTFSSNAVDLTLLNVPGVASNTTPYSVTFEFSEDVIGFTLADILVQNGSAGNFVSVDGNTYTADITPDDTGDITVTVPDNAATDSAGFDQSLSATVTTTYNVSAPTVTIGGALALVNNTTAYPVTFTFSEDVTDFIAADVVVTNGTLSNFNAVDGTNYTADIAPNGNGDITIAIPENVAIDIASNGNAVATPAITQFDNTAPAITIQGLPARINNTTDIPVTFSFNESVTGFNSSSINVTNGTLTNFIAVNSTTYTADLTPTGTGNVGVSVAAAVAQDTAGNDNSAASPVTVLFDDEAPVIAINQIAGDDIINATEDDSIVVIAGTTTGLEEGQPVTITLNGNDYITNVSSGLWSVNVPAVDAQALGTSETVSANTTDLAGNAATTATRAITHDNTAPAVPTVTQQLTNDLTPAITIAAALQPGDALQVQVGGNTYAVGDGNLVDNTDGTYTLIVPSALTENTFDVTATVTDSAGNSSPDSTSGELEIDITPPATPNTAPDLLTASDSGTESNDNITNDNTPTLTVPAGTETADLVVKLYANGIEVGNGVIAANGSFSIDASTLADANYAIRYSLTDAAGNESALSLILNMAVDTTTVVPTINSPAASSSINLDDSTNVLATGTAEAGAKVDVVFSDGVTDETVTVTANGSGNWTLLNNEADLSALSDGPVTLDATATDIAGNSEVSVTTALTLDATAPVPPAVDPLVINTTTPTITGTADTSNGEVLVVTVSNVDYPATGSDLTDNGNGTWSLTIPGVAPLSETTYDVAVSLTDDAGNEALDNTTDELTIDLTPPAIPTVISQITNTDQPTILGTAVVAADESLTVTVNSVTYDGNLGHLVTVGNDWTLSIPALNALGDNTFNVTASVTDLGGNVSDDSTSAELVIDTIDPTAPTVTAQLTNQSAPTLQGNATVANGEVLTVSVNNILYTAGNGDLTYNSANDTWTLVIPPVNNINDGTYDVLVSVTDAAGNVASEATSGELTIDTGAPGTPGVAPNLITADDSGDNDTDNLTSVTAPTFDVPAATAVSGDTVTLYVDGAAVATDTVAPAGDFSIAAPALADGSYSITYTLTDAAGNESAPSPALSLTVDTTTSAPVITTPIEIDNIVNIAEADSVLVTGTSEANAVVLVSLYDSVNPAVQVTVTADAAGNWTLIGTEADISALNAGVISIDASATDLAGNIANATTASVTFNVTVPTVTLTAVTADNIINATEDNTDITLSGVTTGVEDGQIVTLSLNGKTYSATVTSNAWSTTLPALDAEVLPATSTLNADVQNLAGNAATTASATITHDTFAPQLVINEISTDNRVNATEDNVDLIIAGVSNGLEDGQIVQITLNAQNYPATVTSNAWSATVPAVDVQALPTLNTVTANADDLAGNSATPVDANLIHDASPPVVSIDSAPVANAANQSAYPVSGSCTAGDGQVTVSITGATPASIDTVCNGGNMWGVVFDVSGIGDGSNVITVDATQSDTAGNVTNAVAIQANKDTSIPSINIALVAGDDYINAAEDDAAVTITGSSSNIEDGQTITVNLDGIDYFGTVNNNAWSVVIPQAAVAALGSSETISADGQSIAGNTAATATKTIFHDSTPPALATVAAQVTNSQSPILTGTVTLSPGDVLTVTVNSVTYIAGEGDLVDNEDGTWTLTIPSGTPLPENIYDVDVTVTDTAGKRDNRKTTSAELDIDLSAPSAGGIAANLINSDDSGSLNNDDITNVVAATFDLPDGSVGNDIAVTLYANGVEIGSGTANSSGGFSIPTVLPGDATHSVTYTTTDVAGNESSPSPVLSVTVDTTITTPVITTPIAFDNYVNTTENTAVLVVGTSEINSIVDVTFDDGVNAPVVVQITADSSGDWTLLGNEADISALNQGTISVDATATDVAGNSAIAAQASITHDSVPGSIPTVTTLIANSATPQINGAAVLGSGDTLTVSVDGDTYTAGAGALVNNGNDTWTLSIPGTNSLVDDTYEVVATITDEAGNTSTDITTDELTVDTVAPGEPTVAQVLTNSLTPSILITAALQPGDSLEVVVGGSTYTVGGDLVDNSNGTYTLTIPSDLTENTFDVTATIIDTAGNTTDDPSTGELVIDTTAPPYPPSVCT